MICWAKQGDVTTTVAAQAITVRTVPAERSTTDGVGGRRCMVVRIHGTAKETDVEWNGCLERLWRATKDEGTGFSR
jgi:hypothetical protein